VDVESIILGLRNELQQVEQAIRSLERIHSGNSYGAEREPKRQATAGRRKKPQEIRSQSEKSRAMSANSQPPGD